VFIDEAIVRLTLCGEEVPVSDRRRGESGDPRLELVEHLTRGSPREVRPLARCRRSSAGIGLQLGDGLKCRSEKSLWAKMYTLPVALKAADIVDTLLDHENDSLPKG
jgi:hypothetical protein